MRHNVSFCPNDREEAYIDYLVLGKLALLHRGFRVDCDLEEGAKRRWGLELHTAEICELS